MFSLEIGRDGPLFERAGLEASRDDPARDGRYAEFRSQLRRRLTGLLLARRDEARLRPTSPRWAGTPVVIELD